MPTQNPVDPSQRLIQLRKRLSLSQRDLAKEFQVSSGAVAFWEKGERPVPGPILKLLDLYENLGEAEQQTLLLSSEAKEQLQQLSALATQTEFEKKSLFQGMQQYFTDYLSLNSIKGQILTRSISQFLQLFQDSKGVTMKFAYLASFIEVGLPTEIRKALNELASRTKPIPQSIIRQVIYEQLGKYPEDLFQEWSAVPLATTSLGQVHRAKLKTGEHVAVKVQNPKIFEILDGQFRNVELMHRISSVFGAGDRSLLDDIKTKIYEECDYLREAKNQRRFQNIFEKMPQIYIPQVYSEYSSKKVLTTEFVPGESYISFLQNATHRQKSDAGKAIHRFILRSTVEFGLMNADPHPSNFIFQKDRVVFLDFGRVVEYEDERLQTERRFLNALVTENFAVARAMLEKMDSVKDPENFNYTELWSFLMGQQTHYMRNSEFKFSREHLIRLAHEGRRFAGRKSLKADKWFFWAFFIHNSAFAVFADLEAELNWREEVLSVLKRYPS